MKICNKCNINKPLSAYSRHKKNKDGLQYSCKLCVNLYNAQYCKEHSEEIIAHKRQDYIDNIEEHRLQKRQDYDKHRETRICSVTTYRRNRRNSDPIFKIKGNLRKRIKDALNHKSKCKNTVKLLGCDGLKLRQHIEVNF